MDANTTTKAGYGRPALLGGLVMGVLSALPIVSAGNVCCCLWVVSGGLMAAYLLQQNQTTPISAGDGALVGLLAGVIGAVVMTLISIPLTILLGPMQRALAERLVSMSGDVPPAMRQFLESMSEQRTDVGILGRVILGMIGFFIFLFLGAIFSTLGGLLGVALFAKKPPTMIQADL